MKQNGKTKHQNQKVKDKSHTTDIKQTTHVFNLSKTLILTQGF